MKLVIEYLGIAEFKNKKDSFLEAVWTTPYLSTICIVTINFINPVAWIQVGKWGDTGANISNAKMKIKRIHSKEQRVVETKIIRTISN